MKVEKIITSTIEQEVQFMGLTLLSEEEYKQYRNNIPLVKFWWWLRSPSSFSSPPYVRIVNYADGLSDFYTGDEYGSVRPALILASESNISIGDKFIFDNHHWTVISDEYALCDEKFCYMPFRNDWRSKNANEYKASDIKKYLDSEWMNMKESEEDDTRRTN